MWAALFTIGVIIVVKEGAAKTGNGLLTSLANLM